MRCLYCGKELPLLKRLRGGEFCSDAHRQQYQEEYTQLALSRLLQANTASEEETPKGKDGAAAKEHKAPVPSAKPLLEMESPALKRREKLAREEAVPAALAAKTTAPAAAALEKPAPVRPTPSGEKTTRTAVLEQPSAAPKLSPPTKPASPPKPAPPPPAPEPPPPAQIAGFLVEVPVAATVQPASIAQGELEPALAAVPVFPRMIEARSDDAAAQLPRAGRVTAVRVAQVSEGFPAPHERGLEVREFVRLAPVVEINLHPAEKIGLGSAQEPLEIEFKFYSPADSPKLWQQPDHPFASSAATLGDLARLDFEITGWSATALAEAEGAAPIPSLPSPKPEEASVPAPPAAPTVPLAKPRWEPVQAERVRPAAVQFEPVHIEPVFIERMASPAVAETAPAPVVVVPSKPEPQAAPIPEPPAPAEPPIPDAVTKPMPVTLHGLAPARGKSVQVFSSALARVSEAVVPVSSALPLRPLMVLGAAPETSAKAPAAPAKPAPEKQEPRPANGKGRKPEVRVLSLHLREEPKKGNGKKEEFKPKPESKPEAPLAPSQLKVEPAPLQPASIAAKSPVDPADSLPLPTRTESKPARPAPPREAPAPAKESAKPAELPKTPEPAKPVELHKPAPMPTELEALGLPKLAVEADGNFWSRLPAIARIGVAAGFLALIAGGIFLTSRGSSAPRATAVAPVTEVGPPISDAGWATDWFTDGPASRATRHVDVLRGSLTLRDYRLEFEGQIEHQAIGWVFRANNKSFYVEKIAIAGTGFEPPVELVKFAVLNGKEQPRERIPLPFKVHLDTMYKIRMDAVGSHFTTWIQDQKVDEWTDARIDAGGVGLYYDNGDIPKLKNSINVMPLRPR